MDGSRLALTKHHGAGNDFLVLLDGDDRWHLPAATVRALCDRRLGVGADGLLRATRGADGTALNMELRNADGSAAEMSGNGIRCMVQAAVDAGWVSAGAVAVDTAAGRRLVHYRSQSPGLGHATVDMGLPELGDERAVDEPPGVRKARTVGMGNPHLVLLMDGDPGRNVVRTIGPRLETSIAGGANVEFVWAGPEPGQLSMRVWERGAGETLACGTGTCAVAAATRAWGLTGERVVVHNPGGALDVELGPAGALLGGPAVHVADVDVDLDALRATVSRAHDTGEMAVTS